jgi:MinD-like ATPase involved in chromosome partitioning or flagellar assembly
VAAEAPGQGVPIRLYARNSPVARCYQELAAEIVADEPGAAPAPAPAPPAARVRKSGAGPAKREAQA